MWNKERQAENVLEVICLQTGLLRLREQSDNKREMVNVIGRVRRSAERQNNAET